MSVQEILGRLRGVRQCGKGWTAVCPAHEDRRASLSVSCATDGTTLLKCHAGCATSAVVAAIGITMADLFPAPPDRADPGGRPGGFRAGSARAGSARAGSARAGTSRSASGSAVRASESGPHPVTYATAQEAVSSLERRLGKRSGLWTYCDAAGQPVGLVVRWDTPGGKDIRPVARLADGWHIAAMPEPRPLYRLPDVRDADPVLVVEGEKCAEAARSLGFTAVTSSGGSQAAGKTDWRPLAGKRVWILPDNDPPGRKYAQDVAGAARAVGAAEVRIVELPGLEVGGDLADWIDDRGNAAEPDALRRLIEELAEAVGPTGSADIGEPIAFSAGNQWQPFPTHVLPSFARDTVTILARAIGCDPAYAALPLLVASAGCIGMSRVVRLKRGWDVPAILWGAVVGESGTAKSPALSAVLRPLRRIQRRHLDRHQTCLQAHEAALALYEAQVTQWRRAGGQGPQPQRPPEPTAQRQIVTDVTVEALAPILAGNPRGLLMARDELLGWVAGFDRYAKGGKGGADLAHWLSVYDGDALTVDRRHGDPRTLYVPSAAVSVLGGIQPGVLTRVMGAQYRESGLAARLLYVCPPRTRRQWRDDDIPAAVMADLGRLYEALLALDIDRDDDGEPVPRVVLPDAEARREWVAYYNRHGERLALEEGDRAAALSKLEGGAARLALVCHYLRWAGSGGEDLVLTGEDMRAGVALAEWFAREALRLLDILDESDDARLLRGLTEWIRQQGGSVTVREVRLHGPRWCRDSAEDTLEDLARKGLGVWRQRQGPGPSSREFVLGQGSDSDRQRDGGQP